MRVYHSSSYVTMAEQRLNSADVVVCLQKMSGKAVAKGMRRDALCELGPKDGGPDGLLDVGLVKVVSPLLFGILDKRQCLRGKEPLPDKFLGSIFVFLLKQMIQKHA